MFIDYGLGFSQPTGTNFLLQLDRQREEYLEVMSQRTWKGNSVW